LLDQFLSRLLDARRADRGRNVLLLFRRRQHRIHAKRLALSPVNYPALQMLPWLGVLRRNGTEHLLNYVFYQVYAVPRLSLRTGRTNLRALQPTWPELIGNKGRA
jgi:hypothetical protein